MKRCPKCNRTYSTDTQKFCTHDGGLLFTIDEGLGQTMQFDSSKVQDEVAKPTTRDLGEQQPGAFDPEATVVSTGVEEGTQQIKARDTGDLAPSQTTQYQAPPPSAPSGPIPPPPTSAPLPPTEVVSAPPAPQPSGPIAQPAAQQGQPSQLLAQPPAKKKSKLPLVLGLVALVLVMFVGAAVVAGYFLYFKRARTTARTEPPIASEPTRNNPSLPTTATPSEVSKPANEVLPYNPPADAVQFLTLKPDLSAKLAPHYVDFSFYYPDRWEKDPKAGTGDSPNFIEVHRQLPGNFTQESVAVSWYDSAGSLEGDQKSFPSFVQAKSSQFASTIDKYRKVSEGPTKIGAYDGYEFRFEGVSQQTEKGQFTIWGRVVWLPSPDKSKTGVTLLMLTTSLAPELQSIDDVGVKGELPMVLDSFRFGK